MRYPVAIERGTEDRAYGVIVPDVPGAFSASDSLDDLLVNAKLAIVMILSDYVAHSAALPEPSPVEVLMVDPAYQGMAWDYVDIDGRDLNGCTY
ncbi:type II toxin-antitoxin system HicB family antitoxin [Dyella sp. C9]|uniref:type II toxin-antitoxin system HicB family antitoxin n=1 Tax=Dyella sp. C9 TaxID=2202154 RepID=UPI000DEEBB1D|nr:type II toxin-antitoxin system HicB family antitoxin [Dyella sp. C9]